LLGPAEPPRQTAIAPKEDLSAPEETSAQPAVIKAPGGQAVAAVAQMVVNSFSSSFKDEEHQD
jgi:hypothetical protein